MRVLQAKLLERKRAEERAEMDALKSDGKGELGQPDALLRAAPVPDGQDLRTNLPEQQPDRRARR